MLLSVLLISCSPKIESNLDLTGSEKEDFEKAFLHHKRWMYDCLKKYIDYSSFVDSSSRPSIEIVEEFKNLFISNAKVWNDYLWEPKYEYAGAYADQVYIYHRIKGLKVSYEDDVLDKFYTLEYEDLNPRLNESDPDNTIYKYTYRIKKGVYYILNKELKVIYFDEPIEHELDFVFYVSEKEKKAYILDILPAKN